MPNRERIKFVELPPNRHGRRVAVNPFAVAMVTETDDATVSVMLINGWTWEIPKYNSDPRNKIQVADRKAIISALEQATNIDSVIDE